MTRKVLHNMRVLYAAAFGFCRDLFFPTLSPLPIPQHSSTFPSSAPRCSPAKQAGLKVTNGGGKKIRIKSACICIKGITSRLSMETMEISFRR
jgi:hypothetical protein